MDQSAHHNWLVKVQSEPSGADDGCWRTETPRWCFCGLTEWPRKCFVLVFAAFRWGFGDFLRRRQPTPEGSLSFHLVRLVQLLSRSESYVKTCEVNNGRCKTGSWSLKWGNKKIIIWVNERKIKHLIKIDLKMDFYRSVWFLISSALFFSGIWPE